MTMTSSAAIDLAAVSWDGVSIVERGRCCLTSTLAGLVSQLVTPRLYEAWSSRAG